MTDLATTARHTIRVIDYETTGFNKTEGAEVIEMAYTEIDIRTASIQSDWDTLCRPVKNPVIPPETKAVHHITESMLEGSQPAAVNWRWMFDGLTAADVLCAHNAEFEKQFHDGSGRDWICTYKAALRVWPDAPGHGNQTLRYWLGIDQDEAFDAARAMPPHRALPDTYVTAHILLRLMLERSVDDLIQITKEPALHTTLRFGKHRGTRYDAAPRDYLVWLRDRSDMGEDVKFSADYWLKEPAL